MNCRTVCCKGFLIVLVMLALALLAAPAFAQSNCLQDEYNKFAGVTSACTSTPNSNLLNCTANDVAISQIPQNSIHIVSGGQNTANGPTCFAGGNVTFTADFDILTTANAANAGGRDNVGLYLALQQACSSTVTTNCNTPVTVTSKTTSTALCGTCADNIISPAHNGFGSDNYHEYDTGVFVDGSTNMPDNCGDTASTDFSPTFGAGSEGVTIQVNSMFCGGQTCTVNGKTGLLLNYCTSWQTPGSAIACYAAPNDYAYPFDPATGKPEAVPGSKSKCNCSTVCLPITPISITATATKSCTTTISSQTSPPLTSCDAGPEGLDAATYTISVNPTVSSGNGVIDAICDSVYGSIIGSPAGCAPLASGVTTDCVAGTETTNGTPYTCHFTAPAIGEIASVSDTVTFYGHASADSTKTFSATSNSVTVYSEDAPSTATVTKSFAANEGACATVRYKVEVANTSGADEVLKLSGLNDNPYGDITKVQGSVLGTNCGQSTGLGTLAGVTFSPGDTMTAFSSTSPYSLTVGGSSYVCHFDAQFCTTSFDSNGCFTHTNAVSATLATDEGGTETCTNASGTVVPCLSQTSLPTNGLTVKECITGTAIPTQ